MRAHLWHKPLVILTISAALLGACAPSTGQASSPGAGDGLAQNPSAVHTPPPQASATPQTTATLAAYGPDATGFPANINPLTGLPVSDPALLRIPALLVSVSHFPPIARPQAGLSFAPFVYEFSITGGETRFLAAFYGQFPSPEVPLTGICAIRSGVFKQTGALLGNRVWLDADRNGVQDQGEGGIPGICVDLLDAHGNLLQSTTTDSNGIYGFNVIADHDYILKFHKPADLSFTTPNVGDDGTDSDAEPSTGETSLIHVNQDVLLWDAGLFPSPDYVPSTANAATAPRPEIGPVRSGRLLYAYIGAYYQDSCLIYAFASPEVLTKLPHCSFVAHNEANGGEMLSIERMQAIAEDNMRHTTSRPFDYSSNVYSAVPPLGGVPNSQINVYFNRLNQSGWAYDPLYQSYLRYVDSANPDAVGVLHADVDRLTGRQLHFENVIVVMADTDVITSTNIDIHLDEGNTGPARLFRDGQVFSITWSTRAGAYERRTGLRRPIQFLNPDGTPVALKPGHTWVIIVTPFSLVEPQTGGVYSIVYGAPAGEAR